MKSIIFTITFLLITTGVTKAQLAPPGDGQYNARLVLSSVDCQNDQLFVDLELQSLPGEEFQLSDQNYRFSWQRNVIPPVDPAITGPPTNPTDRSIFIFDPFLQGFVPGIEGGPAFYNNQTIVGSVDTVTSVNVALGSPDGKFIPSDQWTKISQLRFNFIAEECVDFIWQTDEDFPQTFVGEVVNQVLFEPEGISFGNLQVCIQNFCNPLPVELVTFEVYEEDCNMRLAWTTETELNNDYFRIEKSTDGLEFKELARVNGSGTTSQTREYNYLDTEPGIRNYYRLVQVDFDGKETVFETRTIVSSCYNENNINTLSELFPNPVSSQEMVNVKFFTDQIVDDAVIVITDVLGKEVDRQTVSILDGPNQLSYNPALLGGGTYFIKIQGNGWYSTTKKFIVLK